MAINRDERSAKYFAGITGKTIDILSIMCTVNRSDTISVIIPIKISKGE